MSDSPRSRSRVSRWGWLLLATLVLVDIYAALSITQGERSITYRRERQIVQQLEGLGGSVYTTKDGRVESASFENGKMTDADLAHLSGLVDLKLLDLHQSKLSDAGLVYLSGLTKLEVLNLTGTKISDAGLAHLCGLKNLISLHAVGTQVSDAGLRQLSKLTKLVWLDLRGTQVTAEGVAALRKALPQCVIQFDVHGND